MMIGVYINTTTDRRPNKTLKSGIRKMAARLQRLEKGGVFQRNEKVFSFPSHSVGRGKKNEETLAGHTNTERAVRGS